MGLVFGRNWKTNNRDLVCFADACAIVLKHHSRTDDDLLNIAEIVDSLEMKRDISIHQYSQVVSKHKEITGRPFQDSGINFYENPSRVGVEKSVVFQKALARHGIDLWDFDPFKVWQLEPGIEKSKSPMPDLEELRNRGIPKERRNGMEPDYRYEPGPMADLRRLLRRNMANAGKV